MVRRQTARGNELNEKQSAYDCENDGKEILVYLDSAEAKVKNASEIKFRTFSAAFEGARHLQEVGAKMQQKQRKVPAGRIA
jgi:hypothetical protein